MFVLCKSIFRYGNRFESSHGDDRTAADHRPVGTTRTTVDRRRRARTVDEDDYGRRKNRDHGDCDDCDDYEDCDDDDEDDLWVARYDESGDFVYRSRATGRSLTTVVEWFKIRHRLIREAMDALKYAFTVSIGASLCNLCIMALYDIYKYSQSFVDEGRSYVFIMLWLFQYTFRFFIIVATAHATTKQVSYQSGGRVTSVFLPYTLSDLRTHRFAHARTIDKHCQTLPPTFTDRK